MVNLEWIKVQEVRIQGYKQNNYITEVVILK